MNFVGGVERRCVQSGFTPGSVDLTVVMAKHNIRVDTQSGIMTHKEVKCAITDILAQKVSGNKTQMQY